MRIVTLSSRLRVSVRGRGLSQTPRLVYAELIGQLLEANQAAPGRVLDWLLTTCVPAPADPARPGTSDRPTKVPALVPTPRNSVMRVVDCRNWQ